MKQSFTAAATDSNDQVQRLRRVSFAMLGLISLALPVYIYAYVTQGDWQLLVLNIVVASVYIPAVLALYLAPRGKATLGALLLIGLLLTVIVVASTLVQGLGYPLGILAMLLPSFIALQTLPPRWIQPVILCSVALGAFTMLYQLFGVQFGVEYALIRSFVPAITAIAIAGFGYLLLRDYGNFQLRNKLLSAFLVVAIIPIALIAVVVLRSTRLTLVAKEADALAAGAQQTRSEVDAFVENARDTIEALSQVPQAAEYLLLSAIQRPGSDGDRDLRVLFNLVKAQNQENISSFALIDLQGQKVFDTSPTSSDESVGQALYFTQPLQTGRPYASPMLFSAATGQPYLYFSSVVRDPANQTVIGVLRVRYRAGALQDVVEQTVGLAGNDSSAIVVDENGLILAHAEFPNLAFKLLGALDSTKQAQLQAQRLLPYDGSAAPLTGFQMLRQGLENAEQSPVFTAGVSGGSTSDDQGEADTYAVIDSQTQSWTVLFHQSADVLASPLVALERQIVVIALAIAALVALVALLLARRLSTPIVRLTALSALIKQGDLAVQAPVTSTDEIGALSGAFNSMTDQLRTTLAGLQQRTVALETSGQVSRRLSSILNPATLTLEVVEQLRGAFNYYHAHIYLFNEAKDTLTMAGGTGRAGRIMLANNHSIPSGRGLVGRAAATRNAVLVPDVSLADGWLANPLLPDTKAEVAVPIMLGDEVLGVLDVQHNIVNGLSHEDAVLVQSIADQVAVGLENARSFERITAVQESLRLRDRAITATRDGIIISDPNQHDMPIVYVNAGFERMTGYTPAEVLGRNCRFLQGDDTNQSEIARLRLALRDKQACRVTLRNYRKDGSMFWNELDVSPVYDEVGNLTNFIGVQKDVTERIEASQQLQEALTLQSTVLNSAPYSIISTNREGLIQSFNNTAEATLGYRVEEALGQSSLMFHDPAEVPVWFNDLLVAADLPHDTPPESILMEAAKRGVITNREMTYIRKDGTRFSVLLLITPIRSIAGEITGFIGVATDITERQLNERERERLLIESTTQQRTLQAILDNLPVGVFSVNAIGSPQIANKAATLMLGQGIDPNASPDSYSEVYQVYHPDSDEVFPSQQLPLSQTLMTGAIASGEVDIVRVDDRIRIEVIAVPIFDQAGTLTSALTLFQDVTERRLNERERERLLRETTTQQRTLQAILDNLPVGVFVVDPTGKPQLINKAATTMLGHGPTQDASPDTYSEVYQYQAFYPDSAEIYPVQELPLARTLITGTITSGEVDIVRANRNRIKLDMTAVPIFDAAGTLTSALALFQNVTERRQNEQERERLLQQVEYRALELQTVAKVSAAASSILERDELLQSVVDLTKVSFNLYQAHIYLLDDVTETLRLTVGAGEIGRAMVAEKRSIPLNREQSLVAQAARTLTAVVENNVTSNPLFLSHRLLPDTNSEMALPLVVAGRVLGVLDVQSERCDAFSAEDVQIQTTLAAQIAVALQNANLYQEQGATVQRLKELDQLKSAFLANMSHELRTPLNSILGFTEVIMEGIDGPINELIEGDLGIIHRNGQHLLTLINDILDMAKIESGKLTLHFEQFNLADVAHEAMRSLSTLATQKDLDVRVQTDLPGPTMITADRFRMRQIMLNVLGNAIKFTDQGRIVIELDATSTSNIIQVHDTGIGIPAESMEAIFTEFQQVDNSSTRKVGGTGLGLPISRHLVEMHGGSIKVQSPGKFGQGSTFRIEIPNQPALIDHAPELVTENGLAK